MADSVTRFAPGICASHCPGTGTLLDLLVRVKPNQIWPDRLYLIRHGESAGNVARDAALKAGEATIDIDIRDVDIPLSELGQRQAIALGRWFGTVPPEERPTVWHLSKRRALP